MTHCFVDLLIGQECGRRASLSVATSTGRVAYSCDAHQRDVIATLQRWDGPIVRIASFPLGWLGWRQRRTWLRWYGPGGVRDASAT